ncbi:hypothetical protein [Nocardia sp. NPDC051832]|uniref:hypothetical protein n=1 Tax=Nocardia sp. NPDC051832 TaxID=3155673 RepID=UPI003441DC23
MRERAAYGRPDREHGLPSRIASVLIMAWLAIGLFAAVQRGYFTNGPITCGGFATIALTAAAGPLNYTGVNPKVGQCTLPQPSE